MQPLNFSFKCLDCGSCYNCFDKLYVAAAVEFLCTAVQLYSVCVLLYFLGLACAHCCTVSTVWAVCVCTVVQCVRPVCVYCCLLQHFLGLRKWCSYTYMQVYKLHYPVLGHILPADIWMCDCPKEQIRILGKFYFYCCSNFRQSPFLKMFNIYAE